jgi:hypothetical protein
VLPAHGSVREARCCSKRPCTVQADDMITMLRER